MWIALAVLALFFGAPVWLRVNAVRTDKQMADGTYAHKFVYVEDDGRARELNDEEIEYLNTKFLPGDGARPYIKRRYKQLTPDGRIGGYLLRRKLPSVPPKFECSEC